MKKTISNQLLFSETTRNTPKINRSPTTRSVIVIPRWTHLQATRPDIGNLVHDVTYMLVVDVQIKERAAPGAIVREDTAIKTKASDDGTSKQTVSGMSNHKEYRARIVTTNNVNLKLKEAQPKIFDKTTYALSGFF